MSLPSLFLSFPCSVDSGFDEHDIPYDVLWLDIEHTDGKRYLTWDTGKFPTADVMQNNLAAKGRKVRLACWLMYSIVNSYSMTHVVLGKKACILWCAWVVKFVVAKHVHSMPSLRSSFLTTERLL